MANVRTTGITFNTTAGDKTVAVTVQPGELAIVICGMTGLTTTPTITDNNADGLGAYTQIGTGALKNSSADKCFMFVRNALFAVGSSTTFTFDDAGTDTGGGLCVVTVKGMTRAGSSAIRSNGKQENQAAAGTPAPVLSNTPLLKNLIIAAVFNGTNPATMTPRAGYTEQRDVGYATPTTGLQVMTLDEGETSATITWGGTSASAFASMAAELDCPLFQSFGHYQSVKVGDGMGATERIK